MGVTGGVPLRGRRLDRLCLAVALINNFGNYLHWSGRRNWLLKFNCSRSMSIGFPPKLFGTSAEVSRSGLALTSLGCRILRDH